MSFAYLDSGIFALFDWVDESNPVVRSLTEETEWTPMEGGYCMKGGGAIFKSRTK